VIHPLLFAILLWVGGAVLIAIITYVTSLYCSRP